MNVINQIVEKLAQASLGIGAEAQDIVVERSVGDLHGDYMSNVAFSLSKKMQKSPYDIALLLCEKLKSMDLAAIGIEKVEAVRPGFVNFFLSEKFLIKMLGEDLKVGVESALSGKKIMVEYAHPNTHKEMHIGHMRTLITGEAISRLVGCGGASVFRANYQGDIGPHVAKAIWGVNEIMKREKLELASVREFSNLEKAHFLGRGYALGSQEYEENKDVIDGINTQLYAGLASGENELLGLYQETRKWSLEYYDDFYKRFYTKFDKFFFESQMVGKGKEIVRSHVGEIFKEENGAVIFAGEEYGLHTRVFITKAGNPTYEGKEMANAFAEHEAFPFDMKVHVVGSEQAGYFEVVFKALELLDPEKFENKQKHVSMGMVTLTDSSTGSGQSRKMSSRTGDILRVDWLLDQIRERVEKLVTDERVPDEMKEEIVEQIVIGAVKYSVLKVGTGQNVSFDIEKSVSIEGNSGPYIQYAYARTQSVLRKSGISDFKFQMPNVKLGVEDLKLLRLLVHYDEVVVRATEKYSPSFVAEYIYELAHEFNLFYQKAQIIKEKEDVRNFRLALTHLVGERLRTGLYLLGIKAPERM